MAGGRGRWGHPGGRGRRGTAPGMWGRQGGMGSSWRAVGDSVCDISEAEAGGVSFYFTSCLHLGRLGVGVCAWRG